MFAGYVVYPLRQLYEKKIEENIEVDVYSEEEAREKCSCIDKNMKYFMWHGKDDQNFPVDDAMD